ncbi:MAG TPA: ABC transporter ATP-binding protein [Hyphomicrobium sp.]|nr:ABC transporter ATP-binding protein [Hyphomicrobium sp.]
MSNSPIPPVLRRYRMALAAAALFTLLETAATLLVPWLGGRLAGSLMSESQATGVRTFALWLVAAFAAQAILRFAANHVTSISAENMRRDLRIRMYDHLQALPLGYFQERRLGEILSLVTNDILHVSNFLAGTLARSIPLLLVLAGASLQMLRIDAALAGLALILVPLFVLVTKTIGRRLRPLSRELQQQEAEAVAVLEENLNQIPAIKEFSREQIESARYASKVERIARTGSKLSAIYSALEPGVQLAASIAVVALAWLASGRLSNGTLAPDQLVSFFLYAALLSRPVGALTSAFGQYQLASAANARLTDVLNERIEAVSKPDKTATRFKGRVEFRDLCFCYPGRTPVLRGLNLGISAGEVIALTGANGAGKSTLVHLLLRLYEPQSGQILIDGIDIADLDLYTLRSQIGIVPQSVLLANATIAQNISFARPAAEPAEIEAAAKLAQAHEFIAALASGYDTPIGDNGIRLSGGQRQRIALARALLKNPPILVLDEATAMFDPEAEASFVAACADALQRRTVILITHRPASLALASRVIALSNGIVHPQVRPLLGAAI